MLKVVMCSEDDGNITRVEAVFTGENADKRAKEYVIWKQKESHETGGRLDALYRLMDAWKSVNPEPESLHDCKQSYCLPIWCKDPSHAEFQALYKSWGERLNQERERLTKILDLRSYCGDKTFYVFEHEVQFNPEI